MGSFKVKLVAYFLLLSLLPMAAAYWGFTSVAGQSETRRVDARLQAGLRSALAGYQGGGRAGQGRGGGRARPAPRPAAPSSSTCSGGTSRLFVPRCGARRTSTSSPPGGPRRSARVRA